MAQMTVTERDASHLRRTLELAARAKGHTSPNPLVGAVVVKQGRAIGEGRSLDETLAALPGVAEGVWTTKAVLRLAKARRVDMPITEEVHAILFEGKPAKQALADLMAREMKEET